MQKLSTMMIFLKKKDRRKKFFQKHKNFKLKNEASSWHNFIFNTTIGVEQFLYVSRT